MRAAAWGRRLKESHYLKLTCVTEPRYTDQPQRWMNDNDHLVAVHCSAACWRSCEYMTCITAKSVPQHRGPWPRSVSLWWMRQVRVLFRWSRTINVTVNPPTQKKRVSLWTLQIHVTAVTDQCELRKRADEQNIFVSLRDCNQTFQFFQQLLPFYKTLMEADCLKLPGSVSRDPGCSPAVSYYPNSFCCSLPSISSIQYTRIKAFFKKFLFFRLKICSIHSALLLSPHIY